RHFDAASGAIRWEAPTPPGTRQLLVHGPTAYTGSGTGDIQAVDTATGKARWSWVGPAPFPSLDLMVVADRLAVVADERVYPLDLRTGVQTAPAWKIDRGAVTDGSWIYAATGGSSVCAYPLP
ncbi:outer membrane protein assembly factor BamB family protein, partial [Pilimelia terevasa]|uniref:outer membrane protein assembly factor BamB family protein n=1 Tax=Pilimelia terevasa TaxID=53372 RepID=UPI001666796A